MHQRARSPHHSTAVIGLALACLFWGLSFPVSKALTMLYLKAMPEESSWFATGLQGALRFLVAGLVMVMFSWPELRSLKSREFWQGTWLGVFGGTGMILQIDGLAYTPASTASFLTQTYCILVPIYHAIVARRQPRPIQLVATAGVIAGIMILSKVDWKQIRIGRGELETLLSTLFLPDRSWCSMLAVSFRIEPS